MSEYDENDDQESEGIQGIRRAKNAAEARATAAEEALTAAQGAQRELGAIKAGLDPAEKSHAFFLSHYEGDLTPEAMKAAAIDAGIMPEIAPEAQASVQGQAQMAQAFQGGEHTPLGNTQVGPPGMRLQVPAEEAEMWTEFQAALQRGDRQGSVEVLRAHGRQVTGIEDTEMAPGAGSAQIVPISGRPV